MNVPWKKKERLCYMCESPSHLAINCPQIFGKYGNATPDNFRELHQAVKCMIGQEVHFRILVTLKGMNLSE